MDAGRKARVGECAIAVVEAAFDGLSSPIRPGAGVLSDAAITKITSTDSGLVIDLDGGARVTIRVAVTDSR